MFGLLEKVKQAILTLWEECHNMLLDGDKSPVSLFISFKKVNFSYYGQTYLKI